MVVIIQGDAGEGTAQNICSVSHSASITLREWLWLRLEVSVPPGTTRNQAEDIAERHNASHNLRLIHAN